MAARKSITSTNLSVLLALSLMIFISPANSAQDCFSNTSVPSTPDSRFTDNADGTVTDLVTGLMWKQCEQGTDGTDCFGATDATGFTWQAALQAPAILNAGGGFAGHTDWRLPNVKELASIVETNCSGPAQNLTFFPKAPSTVTTGAGTSISRYVWTSSPSDDNAFLSDAYAWYVDFNVGYSQHSKRDQYMRVRLVRDTP
jgi:hypothetical protein